MLLLFLQTYAPFVFEWLPVVWHHLVRPERPESEPEMTAPE